MLLVRLVISHGIEENIQIVVLREKLLKVTKGLSEMGVTCDYMLMDQGRIFKETIEHNI